MADLLPLVGAIHRRWVSEIGARFDEAVTTGQPQLVVLEAPSGWGKTRVIQEFYLTLAVNQERGWQYWPSELPVGDCAPDQESCDQNEHLPWLWWSFAATHRGGDRGASALASSLEQLLVHEPAVRRRMVELSPNRELAMQVMKETLPGLGASAAEEVGLLVAERALDVGLPGAGLLVTLTRLGWQQRRRWAAGEMIAAGETGLLGRRALAPEVLARQLASVAAAGLPVILAVDDGIEDDEALAVFLASLLREAGPVLIVVSVWSDPVQLADNPSVPVLGDELATESRLRADPTFGLAASERRELIGHCVPDASRAGVEELITAIRSPGGLVAACESPRIREALRTNDLRELRRLPQETTAHPRGEWERLPEPVKEALSLAVLTTPAAISSGAIPVMCFDPELTIAATESSDRDLMRGITGSAASTWVAGAGSGLVRFTSDRRFAFALEAARDRFAEHRRSVIRSRLRDDLIARLAETVADESSVATAPTMSAQRRRLHAQLRVAIALTEGSGWSKRIAQEVLLLIADYEHTHDTGSLRVVATLSQALILNSNDPEVLVSARKHYLAAAGALGHVDRTLEEALALHDLQRSRLGAGHPDTLWARGEVALWRGRSGQAHAALEAAQSLYDVQCESLGEDSRDAMRTLGMILTFTGRTGDVEAAVMGFEELHERQRVLLGGRDRDTLWTLGNHAVWLVESGALEEGIEKHLHLLREHVREFGRGDPRTLWSRGKLAGAMGRSGRTTTAARSMEALLADIVRHLGSDHPYALRTRSNLAMWLGESGYSDRALEAFRGLIHESKQTLGERHRDTLWLRDRAAMDLAALGRFDEALAQFRELLETQRVELGRLDESTLWTHGNYALQLGESGDVEAAIAEFEVLLRARRELYRDHHPEVMWTAMMLAWWRGRAGAWGHSAARLRRLAEEATCRMSTSHPYMLWSYSRWVYCSWRAHELQGEAARTASRDAVEEQQSVLGRSHPDTVQTRIEQCRVEASETCPQEARLLAARLLDDATASLGQGHVRTRRVAELLSALEEG